jgi:hypothetical protein
VRLPHVLHARRGEVRTLAPDEYGERRPSREGLRWVDLLHGWSRSMAVAAFPRKRIGNFSWQNKRYTAIRTLDWCRVESKCSLSDS